MRCRVTKRAVSATPFSENHRHLRFLSEPTNHSNYLHSPVICSREPCAGSFSFNPQSDAPSVSEIKRRKSPNITTGDACKLTHQNDRSLGSRKHWHRHLTETNGSSGRRFLALAQNEASFRSLSQAEAETVLISSLRMTGNRYDVMVALNGSVTLGWFPGLLLLSLRAKRAMF